MIFPLESRYRQGLAPRNHVASTCLSCDQGASGRMIPGHD